MIKNIQHNNVQTTPFVAIKHWTLLNTHAQDLILLEDLTPGIIIGETFVAQEYVDYYDGSGEPYLNRECNIAMEQQTASLVRFDEGEKNDVGFFYPNSEPTGSSGHYTRLIYSQINNMFYNTYKDPTKIWGIEDIDFPHSKTHRFLSDKFRMFTLNTSEFGEKIVPGSITMVDNSLDDNYIIHDDSNGNLVASENLFSRVQEVRPFPQNIEEGYYGGCNLSLGDSTGFGFIDSGSICDNWGKY